MKYRIWYDGPMQGSYGTWTAAKSRGMLDADGVIERFNDWQNQLENVNRMRITDENNVVVYEQHVTSASQWNTISINDFNYEIKESKSPLEI